MIRLPHLLAVSTFAAIAVGWAGGDRARPAEPVVRFGRDVRPLLSDRCFKCHGPDAATRQADLRLDLAETATAAREGTTAIVPGDAARSEMWRRITSDDPDVRMPPPDSGRRALSAEEREVLRAWIEEGAAYEPHWAFVAPRRPSVPEVRDTAWPRNDVDRFVLARLERAGLAPSPEADRPTLLRRLFLDVTGLPPTPEERAAFLADEAAGAWERWVDRLLDEEPWRSRSAEHRATPWLDASRYADTNGIHMDGGRSIWPWRDWLLASLRDDVPYDRLVTEMVAGDLLPNATLEQRIASGFHRNSTASDEGGAIDEEYRIEYAIDRMTTTGSVFLGMTFGCARCHDHKFDPVTQEDFYGLMAFFASNDERGIYPQVPEDPKRAFVPALAVPSASQVRERAEIVASLEREHAALDAPVPGEEAERSAFFAARRSASGAGFEALVPREARSSGGSTLTIEDGAVTASGENPAKDDTTIVATTGGTGLRTLLVEALPNPARADGRVGRAPNGNVVLSGVDLEAVSIRDPSKRATVRFTWAWADVEQENGDYGVANLLDGRDDSGWAVDAHTRPGGSRLAWLVSEAPFGFEGGTELRTTLRYRSVYAQHSFARVRLWVGRIGDAGLETLPIASSSFRRVGPFAAPPPTGFAKVFGPEEDTKLDLQKNFGDGNSFWRPVPEFRDGIVNALAPGQNVTYVGRHLYAPTARRVELSLGSDDGIRVFLDAREVFAKEIDRPAALDQERVVVDLPEGASTIVLKIVNTGGPAGFAYGALPRPHELGGSLAAALLPDSVRPGELGARMAVDWRLLYSPGFRERREGIAKLEKRLAEIDREIPRSMVMQELAQPRPTFVLKRGQYDQPDETRPVAPRVPAALGALPAGAPRNRLGLAEWLVAPENPLTARVAANRLWESLFGTGLVRTSEDFGFQSEWPSHPELLDWLAVELRESGWDLRALRRSLLTSATYRQDSRLRPEAREIDSDNRLCSSFPRRRLSAEQIRDQALFVSGQLVERFGGPSVKPYQPDDLWKEVAMTQSNTRNFQRGEGDDLWRRSLYTYWKRACPPPSLMTFDAPTREFCTVQRALTNTPLQALVLWNDEQFVEASRLLAQRVLSGPGDDVAKLTQLLVRCTGREPLPEQRAALESALSDLRARYRAAPEDAAKLLAVGMAPRIETIDAAEHAAWTLLANAVLSADATITRP